MSYIHEALKKAQKEKETRYQEVDGIVSTPGHKPRFYSGKVLWLIPFFLISLAFAVYLWLPSGDTQTPIREPVGPEATPKPQSVVRAADLYEKARDLHRKGSLQEAMRLYRKTLSLDPNYIDALNNLGVTYIQNRMYPAARESFAKAIRLKPDHVDSHYNLACLDALQGRLRQSLTHLKKAVSLDRSVKEWAIKDADLRNLRGVPEFEQIIGRSRK
jgi:tetratricopeptide (TPR) repeat protein